MHWKTRIYETAYRIANRFVNQPHVVAVAIGGSIGRGMTWKHSDLELCLLVDQRIPEYQYFNFMDNLGVEIIQIRKEQAERFIHQFREPDSELLRFPIQAYKCKIVHDPSGLMGQFKQLFDTHLFHPNVTRLKKTEALERCDIRVSRAKELIAKGMYNTAIAHLRIGLNDLLMAYYWEHHILPRSQNRTIAMLKKNSQIIGHDKLYRAFIEIYGLQQPMAQMKQKMLNAKNDVYRLSETNLGSGAPDFLEKALDSNMEWGHGKSVVYVYKWCVHRMQCNDIHAEEIYDTDGFRSENERLFRFLDFEGNNQQRTQALLEKYEEARAGIC